MPNTQCICEAKKTKDGNDLVFQAFTLDKKPLIDSFLKPWGTECSDLSFTNLFIWGADGKMEFAVKDNVLYIKLDFKRVPMYFWAPIPKFGVEVDYKKAVCTAVAYMKKAGTEPTFRSVSSPFYEMMREACPEFYSSPTDIAWDYVYEREKLATLKGKKLHGKRNHINKFLSLYPDYEYKRIDKTMINDCIALFDQWGDERDTLSDDFSEERRSVIMALNNMDVLGLVGGALFVEGRLIAFTIGERLQPHIQLVHIEKADSAYEGAYPMINQQYVLNECKDVELINREEDMGIEGMRKAKRAYYPVKMIEKYMFSVNDPANIKGIWGWEEM